MDAIEFENQIQNLKVNKLGREKAPHKAVLLLTVIDLIETGIISSPFIPLSDNLENTFNTNWKRYVSPTSRFSCSLNYPFFHLSTSSFWNLKKLPTYEERKEYSMPALKRSFSGAIIPEEIFDILKSPKYRNELRNILISTYITSEPHQYMGLPPLILIIIAPFLVA